MQEYKQIIDRYIDKWDKILFSTQPVDREKATKAVIDAYSEIDLSPPEIFFVSSPSLEQNSFFYSVSYDNNPYPIRIKNLLYDKTMAILKETPIKNIELDPRLTLNKLQFYTRGEIFENLCNILHDPHIYNIHWDRNINFHKILEYELSGTNVWPFEFYIDHISDRPDIETWNILRSLCEECPYLITYEKVCLVIDRPSELYLDRELVPHAEGKAAIKYADGYELYCNHGTVIPAKYGQTHPSNWRGESIVSDEDNNVIREDSESIISVLMSIGYKKFSEELPDLKNRYWNSNKGSLRTYPNFIEYSLEYILKWLNFHYYDYYSLGESYYTLEEILDWEAHRKYLEGWYEREQKMYKNLPFKVSEELKNFYRMYVGDYQLAPGLDFQPLSKAIDNFQLKSNDYLLPISYGDRQEIYYVLCDNIQRPYSHVYCQLPNAEPFVYAECISSLMATIAQCYRDGGYYVDIDEQSGQKEIKQNLEKIEPIFEKFNPEQIDNWRRMWRA
jgi:hypothetical protein